MELIHIFYLELTGEEHLDVVDVVYASSTNHQVVIVIFGHLSHSEHIASYRTLTFGSQFGEDIVLSSSAMLMALL
jgi:hypothetical protein